MADYTLNELNAVTAPASDDLMHTRNTSGLDKKITWDNLRSALLSYSEKTTSFTTVESNETKNKIQVFRNTHTAGVTMTLGTSGKTINMIPNEVVFVVYNGTTWYQLNDLIQGSATSDKVIDFAADASLVWDESANKFIFNKSVNLSAGTTLPAGDIVTADIADNAITQVKMADNSVGASELIADSVRQSELKTSTGSVYGSSVNAVISSGHLTLPGGTYAFYPQTRRVTSSGVNAYNEFKAQIAYSSGTGLTAIGSSYTTRVWYTIKGYDQSAAEQRIYFQTRYVTSSGEVYWIFLLKEKDSINENNELIVGNILQGYQAPDHPSFGNGNIEHPFPDYDAEKHEIIVVNPLFVQIKEIAIKAMESSVDIFDIINEEYTVEEIKTPLYPEEGGAPGYFPTPITVGLDNINSFPFNDNKAEPLKKVLTRPSYINVKKLSKKA